ncbi:transmembrane protein, putative [Medicago truncatula]|uniref:Transmembrane protein, putative n=1 Tax=Medicago truncatula TaxID=3880 RepID=G7I6G6_MEDTR|nr:transmembrane protein, putative [Medicago truncatula]
MSIEQPSLNDRLSLTFHSPIFIISLLFLANINESMIYLTFSVVQISPCNNAGLCVLIWYWFGIWEYAPPSMISGVNLRGLIYLFQKK